MSSKSKTLALLLTVIYVVSPALLLNSSVEAQSTTASAPAVSWQQVYSSQVLESSNLIQTIDGGFVFMDLGYTYHDSLKPTTLFKVNSVGNMEWNITFELFTGSRIIQTNDEGYEISGWWHPNGTYSTTPTLLKTDSQGNIQWNKNYTDLPNLDIDYSEHLFPYTTGHLRNGSIKTSDGGFAFWTTGNITKSDTNNNTQWVKALTYYTIDAYPTYQAPLTLTSVIETSDGALAALGVGPNAIDNMYSGKIYLIKLTPNLPIPSQKPLPTPLPTPSPTPNQTPLDSLILIIPVGITVLVIAIVLLLLYMRYRKSVT